MAEPLNPSTPERAALAAGGIAALLAGACCLGPFVLVSIGIGGAWLANFQLLEPYRPVLLGVAIAALGFAGWRIYRPAARRGSKIGFWLVGGLLLLTLTFPYYASLLY